MRHPVYVDAETFMGKSPQFFDVGILNPAFARTLLYTPFARGRLGVDGTRFLPSMAHFIGLGVL